MCASLIYSKTNNHFAIPMSLYNFRRGVLMLDMSICPLIGPNFSHIVSSSSKRLPCMSVESELVDTTQWIWQADRSSTRADTSEIPGFDNTLSTPGKRSL